MRKNKKRSKSNSRNKKLRVQKRTRLKNYSKVFKIEKMRRTNYKPADRNNHATKRIRLNRITSRGNKPDS